MSSRSALKEVNSQPRSSRLSRTPEKSSESSQGWVPRVELAESYPSTLATKVTPVPKYSRLPSNLKTHIPLDNVELTTQEALIIDDLLHVMMGCEGYYIRYSDAYDNSIQFDRLKGPEYRISKSLDPSFKDLARSILDTCQHFSALTAFIESQSRADYGQVNQALCAAIRKILNDYLVLVAQLEYQAYNAANFSLHSMNIQLKPIAKILRHTFDLAQVMLKENDRKSAEAASAFNDFDKVLESLKEAGGNINELGVAVSSSRSTVCKGGTVLRIIAERLNLLSGDPVAQDLLHGLLRAASKPYLKMLSQWIHKGVIDDPYQEFLIRELKGIKRENLALDYTDEYWEKRYTVRKEDLPLQFSNPDLYQKVLLAGKYLNVVRECGGSDASTDANDNFDSIEDSKIILSLSEAYVHANQSLLDLLVRTHDLPARLKSLKHYFFLDRADYFISFMDIAEKELSKSSRKASITKLQYLLDMSLRQPGSVSSGDPFKEDVIVEMNHTSVTDFLLKIVNVSGMDPDEALGANANPQMIEKMVMAAASRPESATSNEDRDRKSRHFTATMGLQLDMRIPFPISLILSRKTILRYQLLFRHLVEIRNIERTLNLAWLQQCKSKAWKAQSSNDRLTNWKARANQLRIKMLLFVQQILYFCTTEVIEPNWQKLQDDLSNAKTVDLIMEQHVYFLDTCMKECMLTNQKLLKLQAKLFFACRMFGDFLQQRLKSIAVVDPSVVDEDERDSITKVTGKNGEELSPDEVMDWLEHSLGPYENSFDHHVKVLTDALNYYAATETTVFLSLCGRIELCMPMVVGPN